MKTINVFSDEIYNNNKMVSIKKKYLVISEYVDSQWQFEMLSYFIYAMAYLKHTTEYDCINGMIWYTNQVDCEHI